MIKGKKRMVTFIVDRDPEGLVYEIQSHHFSGIYIRKRSEHNNVYKHILPENFGIIANFRSDNFKYDVDLKGQTMLFYDEISEDRRQRLNRGEYDEARTPIDLSKIDFAFTPTKQEMEKFNRKDHQLAYLHSHGCLIPKTRIYPVPFNEEERALIIEDINQSFSGNIVIKNPTGYRGRGNTFLDLNMHETELEETISAQHETFIVQEQAHKEKEDKDIEKKGYATYRSIIVYSPDLPEDKSLMLGTVNKYITHGSFDSHQAKKLKLYFDDDNDDNNPSFVHKPYKENKYGTANHPPVVQDNMKKTAKAGYDLYKDINSLSHEDFLIGLSQKASKIIYGNCIVRDEIFTALRVKNLQLVEYLLNRNTELAKHLIIETDLLLRAAVRFNCTDLVFILLDNALSVRDENQDINTILRVIFDKKNISLDKLFREAYGNINGNICTKLLSLATEEQNTELAKLLIETGINLNTGENSIGKQLLFVAAQKGDVELINLLIEKGVDILSVDDKGWTSLHHAACNDGSKVVRLLLEKGAEVNAITKDRSTALHYAVEEGCVRTAKLLINAGADIYAKNNKGETVLDIAQRKSNKKIIDILCSKEEKNKKLFDTLKDSSKKYYPKFAEEAIELGADIDAIDDEGQTPLDIAKKGYDTTLMNILCIAAIQQGKLEYVKKAIKLGVKVNAKDRVDSTLLHSAAEAGRSGIAEFLLKNGADVNAAKSFDETPLDPLRKGRK